MFNLGFGEMILLAAIALIFIGPKQLPEIARVVGRMLNEFKRATDDLTGSFVKSRDNVDNYLKNTEKELQKSLEDTPEGHVAPALQAEVEEKKELVKKPEEKS